MKQSLIAGAVAIILYGQPCSAQQSIPDAPRPQTPQMNNVAPGKAPLSSTSAVPQNDPDQPAVGATLPSTSAATQTEPDDQAAPDLPTPGQGPTYTLNLQANFVDVPFTVKDNKGRLVPGLTWRDVRVYENGLRQQLKVFTVDPFPLSISLVIDQSLPFDTMNRVNSALGALQTAFSPYDEVAVFTYNNGPKLQTDFTAGQSARLAAVVERSKTTGREAMNYSSGPLSRGIDLNSGAQDHYNPLTAPGPGSPMGVQQVPRETHTLNDAILMAAEATTKVAKGRRRIVYVISDGKEYGSVAKTKQVIKYLQQNKVAVYATLVGDSSVEGLGFIDRIHLPLMMRDNILPVYTAATGGQTFAEYRQKAIENSFAQITEQVRTQYTIGFYSKEPFIDGKYRSLEVRVLRPNLQVFAKPGYYPTAQDIRPNTARPIGTTPPSAAPGTSN